MLKKGKIRDLRRRCLTGQPLPAGYKKQATVEEIDTEFEKLADKFIFEVSIEQINEIIPLDVYKKVDGDKLSKDGLGKYSFRSMYNELTKKKEKMYSREIIEVEIGSRFDLNYECFHFPINSDLEFGNFRFTFNTLPTTLKENDLLRNTLEKKLRVSATNNVNARHKQLRADFEKECFQESNWASKGKVYRNRGKLKADLKKIARNYEETDIDCITNTSKKDSYSNKKYFY